MRRRPSLTNRIFLAAALLVVLAVASTAAFVSTRVAEFAEGELRRSLSESGAVVERQCGALAQEFSVLARLTADLPKLKAAVATGDAPTVQPLAAEYREMIARAGLVVVTDRAGRILANTDPGTLGDADVAALPSVRAAREGRPAASFWPHQAGVLQVVSAPITIGAAPATLAGTLSLGFLLDASRASDFKTLTGSDIAFGLGGRIRAATLSRDAWTMIDAARSSPEAQPFRAAGVEFVALSRALGRADGPSTSVGARAGVVSSADSAGPYVVVLRSRTEQQALLSGIRRGIAFAGGGAILLATLLSYAVARSVTRPLAAITGVMRDMAATGDLATRIPIRAGLWDDDDARVLATTFNALTESVSRFEKEAALRERLSSLGRLSSVVAHEIRNPLMIIKTAVRTLRRSDASSEACQEALQDIDAEIARINRIVSDVLDYAKPLSFEWHETDVDAVCRDAVRAVDPGDAGITVHCDGGTDGRILTTDANRLRTVVVNVIENGVHAVRTAMASGTASGGDVCCRTEVARNGDVRIVIADSGPGMDAPTVARAFEPFFTTRRGGTGLGLAIVRHIVDGLGGSIAVRSAPGEGAVFSISIPDRNAAAGGPDGVAIRRGSDGE